MKKISMIGVSTLIFVCLLISFSSTTVAQTHSTVKTAEQKNDPLMKHANGTFEVNLTPRQPDEEIKNPAVNRMSIVKHFHGDLEAESLGQMLAFRTEVKGSAGYVAMERVTGMLDGRNGSFVLQHSGIMDRSESQLSVTVVPDSGTDELVGLKGTMTIKIENGEHFYEFEYSLTESP
jgi:hypothetical protein